MCKKCVGISADSIIVLKHYSIYEYKISCRKVENAKPRAADCCHHGNYRYQSLCQVSTCLHREEKNINSRALKSTSGLEFQSQFQHDSRAVFNLGCCALQSLLLLVSAWLNMILMYLTKKWCLWMKNECFIEPAICDSDSNHPSCLVSGRDRCCSVDLPSYMCHPSERRADRWCSRHVGSRPNTWH